MANLILDEIYKSEKYESRGFSDILFNDLSSWVNDEYEDLLGRKFNPEKLKDLVENLDSKLPKEFNYESLVEGLKKEIVGLKKRNYTDLQISTLTSIIDEEELSNLERNPKKPKKTLIGFATVRYRKSLTTKLNFIDCVNNYFRNYIEIVTSFNSKAPKIAKSIALIACRQDSLKGAIERAERLYNQYILIFNKYKQEDEEIARSIAIRSFHRSVPMAFSEKFYQNFKRVYKIYSVENSDLARSIAHWTFMAKNPEEQAKKIYGKLKQKPTAKFH